MPQPERKLLLHLDARDFLARAQARLAAGSFGDLVYAALDLRLGTESRLHEYLDATKEVARLKKRGWQVRDLARDLERTFRLGDKVASVTVVDQTSGVPVRTFLYTPVRRSLQGIIERLGDYLHISERTKPGNPAWMATFRELLEHAVRELEFATTGTLLAPPVWNEQSGESRLLVEFHGAGTFDEAALTLGKVGDEVTISVAYLDDLPPSGAA